jgi:cysteine-rich repeat protein
VVRRGGTITGPACLLACASACVINPAFDVADTGTSVAEVTDGPGTQGSATTTGPSPGSSDGPGTSDGGDEAVCGNGAREGDEPCDDGNQLDGDGCNAGCVLSGGLLWEIRHDGGDAGWDAVHDLVVLADDSIAVAGVTQIDGLQAELVRIDVDGAERWSHRHAVEAAGASDGWGAATLGDTIVLAGSGDDGTMFVRAVDPDGVERWTFENPGHVYDATSDRDTELWIAGEIADGTAALWHLDADGGLVAIHDEQSGSMPAGSVVWGIGQGSNGRIASTGQVDASARAWVRELYGSGGVAWETDVLELGADSDSGYGVTIAPGGALAMVGDVVRGVERNGWLLRRDTGGRLLPAIEQVELGNYHGVAIGPSGEIAVSGWVDNGLGKIALVVKYAVDGSIAWRHEVTGDVVVGENKAWTVGIRSDQVVVAAGELVETATGLDRWIIAYAP